MKEFISLLLKDKKRLILLLILIGGLIVAVMLVQVAQDIRERAAIPGGQTTVALSPESGTYDVGQSFPVTVLFNTAGIPISAVTVRITYPLSGGAPPALNASDILINPELLATGEWSCPVRTVTPVSGTVQIDIGCANISIDGFVSPGDTQLATFTMVANSVPVPNPIVLSFDPTLSIITNKSEGKDILLIPVSTGLYTITSDTGLPPASEECTLNFGVPSLTPTPSPSGVPSPTPTQRPTSTPTSVPTGTPTGVPTSTPTNVPTSTPTSVPTSTPTGVPTSTPTDIPTPTPTDTIVSQCLEIRVYDTSWRQLTASDLGGLSAGDRVRFTVLGSTTAGIFDKAIFAINGVLTAEITDKRPGTEEFYTEYEIKASDIGGTISVNAWIHHAGLDLWF